eukprot:scaffold41939_cov153-Amphora_coffeaeformis.AAC.1
MPPRRSKRKLPPPSSMGIGLEESKPKSRGRSSPAKTPPAAASSSKKRKQEPREKIYAKEIQAADVLMGRGPGVNCHEGNVKFRNLVKKYIKRYTQADKTGKTQLCQKIVDHCKQNGVSFLEKDKDNNQWFHITAHTARTKAAQTMQDIVKRREKGGSDASSDEELDVDTSGFNSEGDPSQKGSNADKSEDEEEEEGGEDEVEVGGWEDLKLPSLPVASAGIGTDPGSIHSAVATASFSEQHETLGEEEDVSSSTRNRFPEAQLRPAAAP